MTCKFQQIKPQKARGKFQESLWTDPAWSAENKEDGDRRIAQFASGLLRITGGKESVSGGYVEKSANLPHLSAARTDPHFKHDDRNIERIVALEGTVLDGEIVAPWASHQLGGKSKYVTAIMGSKPERAIQLQKRHGWLEYRVFDCLWYKGKDIRQWAISQRRLRVLDALNEWNNEHANAIEVSFVADEKRAMWQNADEGLVFKSEDHTYGNEKLWVKLKKKWTADVVIMGFEPGKGKYAGSVGAIVFGQHVTTVNPNLAKLGTCRGFTDAQMNQFTASPKKFIGRVIEIEHYGREPTGAFRSPQFKHFRPDKNAADCVYDPEET